MFSPDGTFLAFYGDGSLKTVSLLGGPALTVVASGVPSGAGGLDWGSDGMLYFTDNEGAIQRRSRVRGRTHTGYYERSRDPPPVCSRTAREPGFIVHNQARGPGGE